MDKVVYKDFHYLKITNLLKGDFSPENVKIKENKREIKRKRRLVLRLSSLEIPTV